MTDIRDLDLILAVEEHRQGRPYLADPDHCARCAEVDQAWAQATCEHDSWVEITRFGDPRRELLCQRCGHMWHEDR